MSTTPNRYYTSWEGFWTSLSDSPVEVLWDVGSEQVAAQDLPRFAAHMDPKLPLIDVGCGNGTQTLFLASRFPEVFGVDVAPGAIEKARQSNAAANITYSVLDLLQRSQAEALHSKIGDANLYLRTVLMQFLPPDRPTVVESLTTLLGTKGALYMQEYPPAAEQYYKSLFERQGIPPGFERVLRHGITPGVLSPADLEVLFPKNAFEVLGAGDCRMQTRIPLADGGFAQPPAIFLVLRRR